jgi:hypothetical protein
MPTWNAWNYSDWGLGSMANSWLYSDYANPYITPQTQTIIVQQPVVVDPSVPASSGTVVAYDYSRPIDVSAPAPDESVANSAEQVFSSARDSFKAGDYPRALALADQALVQLPNDTALHEFRALCLFALKRYNEAASVNYTVLSAGPGWDWATLVGLYPDVDTYTNQLRALEAYVREHSSDPAGDFLLGYHYMVQGNSAAAMDRFKAVAQLQPNDQLSGRIAEVLAKAQPAAQAPTQPGQPPQSTIAANTTVPSQTPQSGAVQPAPSLTPGAAVATSGSSAPAEQPPPPPPPPAEMAGTWKAQPAPGVSISLTLGADGAFTWAVTEKSKTQSLQGKAGFQDGILALNQEDGKPLIGKVTREGDNKFTFKPPGAPDTVKGLEFTRS